MTGKAKKILYIKFVILIACTFIILRLFVLILSKYESEVSSYVNVDIAFYLLKEDFQTMTLNLDSLFPQDVAYIYTFSIGNEDGEKTADVDMEYNLRIRTTTNLPLTYELYMNDAQESAITSNTVEKDEHGTYFRILNTEQEFLEYSNPKTNIYKLFVYFPANYNTVIYQDIIEMIEITVDSKQVLEST